MKSLRHRMIELQYVEHKRFIRNAWEWRFDSIKYLSTNPMLVGNCARCEHFSCSDLCTARKTESIDDIAYNFFDSEREWRDYSNLVSCSLFKRR